jgi:hypothetical protein
LRPGRRWPEDEMHSVTVISFLALRCGEPKNSLWNRFPAWVIFTFLSGAPLFFSRGWYLALNRRPGMDTVGPCRLRMSTSHLQNEHLLQSAKNILGGVFLAKSSSTERCYASGRFCNSSLPQIFLSRSRNDAHFARGSNARETTGPEQL